MTLVKGNSDEDHLRFQRRAKGPIAACPAGPRKHWGLPLVAIAVVVAAALTAACDDSQDQAPPTTTPTTTPSPEQQLLEQVILVAEDLPAGLEQVDAGTSTNEEVAANEADPKKELARLESLGRVLGYEANFLPGSDSPPERGVVAVTSTASVYLTPEGASESFAHDAEEARSADWLATYPDLTDPQVREVDRPELADEVIWMRITGIQDGEDAPLFIEDFLVLRRSRLRGFLRAVSLVETSAGRDALLQDVADLAALSIQRIDAALDASQS